MDEDVVYGESLTEEEVEAEYGYPYEAPEDVDVAGA